MRMEDAQNPPEWLVVHQYAGLSTEDAVLLRFGPDGPPKGAELVFIVNALTPAGIDLFWARRKGTPEYMEAWAQLYLRDPGEFKS